MLTGKKICLIVLEKKHLESLRQLRNEESTNKYLTYILPINEVAQMDWFEKTSKDPTKLYMAIENKNGDFIGIVRADEWDKINRSIRIGVDIVKKYRQKGYATETYFLLFKFLFENIGINRVWLEVAEYNTIALSLYKKLGFIKEGILRETLFRENKFYNYIVMSLLKKDYEKKYKK